MVTAVSISVFLATLAREKLRVTLDITTALGSVTSWPMPVWIRVVNMARSTTVPSSPLMRT
jgi:hypothetical protein